MVEVHPRRILIAGTFLIVILLAAEPVKNYDIWWHLKTGEIIYSTGEVPHSDPFSYTKAGEAWINHAWLSQLIFYLVYSASGFYGIVMLKVFLLLLSLYVVYRRNALHMRWYCNIPALILIVMISKVSWVSRPLLFTFLLLPLLLYLLDLLERGNRRALLLLPPLFALWANLHGGFIVGLALLFLYSLRHLSRGDTLPAKIFVASLAAVMVNPYTYQLLTYPLQYATYSVHSRYIVEWQSPSFSTFTAFEAALLLSLAVLALSRRVERFDLLLLLLFTHLGLFAIRNGALYAVV
ncbi:MAG: hypothetical protein GXO66_07300, partial [Euryarchaeota archaeon]|nr:hypothetical protein [Euryarchaeota archaeon]